MTIDELNALTTLTATDEVPVWDSEESGEPTKKITASNLAASVKSLGSLIGTGDLDSTPTQGSNKAVTSGGTYTAIQQSTADSGWLNLNTGIDYRLHHGIVFVNFNKAASLSTTSTVIGTLPTGYRPAKVYYFRCVGSKGVGGVTVNVGGTGNISARVDSGTSAAINGLISFILG